MGQSRKLLRSSGPPWVRIPRLPPVRPRASMEIHEKPAEQGKRESASMGARRRFRCVTLKWGWRATRRSERCRRRHPASGCPMLPVSRSSSSITHPMGRPSRTSIGPAKCESHRGANQTAKSADRPAKRERAPSQGRVECSGTSPPWLQRRASCCLCRCCSRRCCSPHSCSLAFAPRRTELETLTRSLIAGLRAFQEGLSGLTDEQNVRSLNCCERPGVRCGSCAFRRSVTSSTGRSPLARVGPFLRQPGTSPASRCGG